MVCGWRCSKIRQLQQRFNELNLGGRLLEDGVYGEKTEKAVADFMQQLLHGSVPTLTWVDPLQSSLTGITSAKISGLGISALWDFSKRSANQNKGIIVFRADKPHGSFNDPHINTVEGRSIKSGKYNPSEFQRANLNAWNHTQISDDAYRVLKDFDGVAKKVRVAGKVLLVTGAALDALELYQTVEGDLHDADRKNIFSSCWNWRKLGTGCGGSKGRCRCRCCNQNSDYAWRGNGNRRCCWWSCTRYCRVLRR